MICPNCGSANCNVQMVTESKLVNKHHGCLWWGFVGWWWVPFKWLFLTLPALIVAIFGHKKQKLKQKHVSMWVCQNCGHHWKAASSEKVAPAVTVTNHYNTTARNQNSRGSVKHTSITTPESLNGEPLQHVYAMEYTPSGNVDYMRIYNCEEKEVEARPGENAIELWYQGEMFGIISDDKKLAMLRDWIKRGNPYMAILRNPGNIVALAFYRDKRRDNDWREQTVTALTAYKSSDKQDVISCLAIGEEVQLDEDYNNNGDLIVIVSASNGDIGMLPKSIVNKIQGQTPYGAFVERIEETLNDAYDTVYKPYIRIYW